MRSICCWLGRCRARSQLGGAPELFKLGRCGGFEGDEAGGRLHCGEASAEFAVGGAECELWLNGQVTGKVDSREENIA